MPRPAFVYFDLGNVLFAFDRARAFAQMAVVSGADAAAIEEAVMAGGIQERLERGACDWSAFHAEFCRRTGTSPDSAALARAASDMFTLRVEMLPVVAALQRADCPVGILSNTCAVHWDFLLARGYAILPRAFAPCVLSHEVRAVKPERHIYEIAATRAGVAPERIFFCDDLAGHVAGARAAGWDAELFTSAADLVVALAGRGLNLGL